MSKVHALWIVKPTDCVKIDTTELISFCDLVIMTDQYAISYQHTKITCKECLRTLEHPIFKNNKTKLTLFTFRRRKF